MPRCVVKRPNRGAWLTFTEPWQGRRNRLFSVLRRPCLGMTPSQKTALPHKVSRMNGANACPRVVQKFIGAYGNWRLLEKFVIRLILRIIFEGMMLLL